MARGADWRIHIIRRIAPLVVVLSWATSVDAAQWFVAPGGSGDGSPTAPLGTIQAGLDRAQPGDEVVVTAGVYRESLQTVRDGRPDQPITLRSAAADRPLIIASGRVITIEHAYFAVDGIVFDGDYGIADVVHVRTTAHNLALRNCEVRRSSRDLIDLDGPANVTIDRCVIHHALNAANKRTDAHGIAAGTVRHLMVRDTEIHTFSGDGLQVDPGRAAPGWSGVTLDGVRIWLEPLRDAENGFAAGTVPGENAVDTKASSQFARATLTIRNATLSGFRGGLIGNMAALNLKENVDATLDRITVFDSEIAFRLRGNGSRGDGARVSISNAVVHDVVTAYRYEDDIEGLRIWNNTIGTGVQRVFQSAKASRSRLDVRNLLVLGTLPEEAAGASNLAVDERAFVDAARHDYRLARGAAAIDAGVSIDEVRLDRTGVARPSGRAYDIGAYEWTP